MQKKIIPPLSSTPLLPNRVFFLLFLVFVFSVSCTDKNAKTERYAKETEFDPATSLAMAKERLNLQLGEAEKVNKIPRTLNEDGSIHYANLDYDWTEGFFPGSLWFLYEDSKNKSFKLAAEHFQSLYESHKYRTTNHDLGFIFNNSYGNGYRLTKNEAFKPVLITAADSLSTRFNENVGCIKSWDVDRGWQAERNWKFPVIIDNMMNLELLFEVSELTKNSKYHAIAVAHANTTLKNHFRADGSSVHVVDYNPETGAVRSKQTAQGFDDNSAWARGQAWGLYGYTVCYRYTKDKRYLQQAEMIADFILEKNKMREDGIPYWDYDADGIPNEPVDVSAAAITASALIELDGISKKSFKSDVDALLETLSSEKYMSKLGENHNFLLMHSVGSIPHGNEIDVPLNYADYYYLEALLRYKKNYLN